MDRHVSSVPPPADAVCHAFALGAARGVMTPVAGGLTHLMWRLETERGAFAIKQINRDWGNPDYVPWYERAFRVELAAFDAGVPMPRPVPSTATGACLAEIDSGDGRSLTLRAHEWVEGAVLKHEECGADEARGVGGMLAQIHAFEIAPTGDSSYLSNALDPAHWRSLLERGAAADWRDGLAANMPAIDGLIAIARATAPDEALIMSHRDSDAKNVLRAVDGRLMLIDWDATGPIAARAEVAKEAVGWAGGYLRDPEPTISHALLDGYRRAGGVYEQPRAEDFAEFMRIMLGWLEFNLRRTLGERIADDAQRDIARREVQHLLGAMPRFARSLDAWARMLATG